MEQELFERAPVPKAYFKFALPVVFSMVFSLVYNMADTYFIARTGNTNLIAGVSLGAPIFTLMIALGDIFGLGGSSYISRLFGQKEAEEGKRVSVFCFYGAIFVGVLSSALLLLFREQVLALLGTNADTYTYASQYYTWIAAGAPFIILSLTPSNILRTEGLTTESMVGSVLGTIVNIILDPIFIFTLHLGASGAAIATVCGNIVADLYFVWVLWRKSQKLSVDIRMFSVTVSKLKEVLVIGIPASVTNLMQSLGIAMVNRALLPYGNEKIAAMGIVMKINMIAVLVMVGFAFGGQPLIGYNYGAKNWKRLKKILQFSYFFECGIAVVVGSALALAAPWAMGRFVQEHALIQTGVQMLRIQQTGMACVAIVLVSTVVFQSTGKALSALLISLARQGVFLCVALAVFSAGFGYVGILASQPAADAMTAVLALLLFAAGLGKILFRY